MPPPRSLKILVVALGLAIVVALGFVIYGFVRLVGGANQEASGTATTLSAPSIGDLGQPLGTEITGLVPSGNTRLAIALKGGGLPDRVVVLDLKTGQVVATTYTSTAPSAPTP